jgi:bifunctional DNA primase/polymerase-like protein/uncharacterized protein DUF3987
LASVNIALTLKLSGNGWSAVAVRHQTAGEMAMQTHLTPLEAARSYLQRGWMPLPVPFRAKSPGFNSWQKFTVTEADLPQHFNGQQQNIGVLLGKTSGDLVDVDLDCDIAVKLAPYFLPTTGATFGRQTRLRSHWLYVAPISSKVTFTDPVTSKRLLEILTNGQQAIFPGSTHKDTGELIQWYEEGEPAPVSATDLVQAAKCLAAATLLAEHWPHEGSRQDTALALAGGLLRAGWTEDKTMRFIEAVCVAADDEETHERIKTVCYTLRKLDDGAHVTGWPTLAKTMDERVVSSVREWLDLRDDVTKEQHANKEQDGDVTAQIAWPELQPTALHGLAGDFVRLVSPHSEADPVALLSQFLAAFGNIIGRSAHFIAEADKHFTNTFLVLVGATGAGRKGTSYGQVKIVFAGLDEVWERDCQAGGMSSGEGLLYHVRDAVTKQKQINADGKSTGVNAVEIVDHGVADKRLMVFEGEFASVLRAQGREGNTLSMIIRNLWDTGDARSLVKNAPLRTTGAHVSIIGHITRDELRSCLDAVESVNGYVNRFLWFCVKRDKFLPRGGRLSEEDFAPLKRRLRIALDSARETSEMTLDDEAWELWDKAYIRLETGRTGLLGKVTQRASPYVRRLACLYALLDCSAIVRLEHLRAALAFWQYAEGSARYIFGGRTGDRIADDVLRALREAGTDGLSQSAISDLFSRNRSKAAIDNALQLLLESGLACQSKDQTEGRGRPAVRWFAVFQSYERNERNTSEADSFVSFVDSEVGEHGIEIETTGIDVSQEWVRENIDEILERAAIMEFDGGLARGEAERLACAWYAPVPF